MNYRQAESYLLDLELFGMRFGLDRMRKLTTVLGMAQRRFASIHIVGTNGKSSTARMIAAVLSGHGLRTGCYTSPHLRAFRERVEVGGQAISEGDFAEAVGRVARAAAIVDRTAADEDDRVTQFEALTAAAFHALARARVEVAVIEAGLGGRHDATNVIPSKVQVLTGVGLEHTRWLGPTLAHIAEEKLAVVPTYGRLVAPALPDEVEAVLAGVLAERSGRRVTVPDRAADDVPPLPHAPGAFQRRNFALATAAAEAFLERPLEEAAVRTSASAVTVPGRLEVAGERPLLLLDGAHNPAAARALAEALPEVVGARPLVGVMAVRDDKDATGILRPLLPRLERALFTTAAGGRYLPPPTLRSLAGQLEPRVDADVVGSPQVALDRAGRLAGPEGAVLVTGSLHLLSDLVRAAGARASAL